MSRHIARRRTPRPAVTVSPIEAVIEGTFTALRHMGAIPIPIDDDALWEGGNPAPLMGPWDDTRTPDEAWALADIDTHDMLAASAVSS
jgi:hypothetical protein